MKEIRGRVWILGDDIDTDELAPFATLTGSWEEARAAMLRSRRELVEQARPGDLLVAGHNLGCGSSRENAAENLKNLGLGAVLAESMARIFFRNCIAIGLPALECPGITALLEEGQSAMLDLERGIVGNLESGEQLNTRPYTPQMLAVVENGLMALLHQRTRKG